MRDPACKEHLQRARAAAERTFGDLGLDGGGWPARVCRALCRRLETDEADLPALEAVWKQTAQADLVLASACADGSERASAALIRAFRGPLRRYCRVCLPVPDVDGFVDGFLSHIYTAAPSDPDESILGTYRGAGSLASWLRILIKRRALDQSARSARERPDDPLTAGEAVPDPHEDAVQDEALEAALDQVFERAGDEHLCLLWCRIALGIRPRLLSQLLDVSEPTLSKTNKRFRELVGHIMGEARVELTPPRLAHIEDRVRRWGAVSPEQAASEAGRLAAIEAALRDRTPDEQRLLDLRIRVGATVRVVSPLFDIPSEEVHARTQTAIRALRLAADLQPGNGVCGADGPRNRLLLDGFVPLLASLPGSAD